MKIFFYLSKKDNDNMAPPGQSISHVTIAVRGLETKVNSVSNVQYLAKFSGQDILNFSE